MKINLRDRFGNMWPVGVNKIGGNLYFQYGWEKFIEDNSVEVGDFLFLTMMEIKCLTLNYLEELNVKRTELEV